MAKAEGKFFTFESEDNIRTDFLEVFDFSTRDEYIKIETSELSAVCPFSGLPDLSYLLIEYYPEGGKCLELKSLKYYVISFGNVGIYQEKITERIYNDFKKILQTSRIRITTKYMIRGGFNATCSIGMI